MARFLSFTDLVSGVALPPFSSNTNPNIQALMMNAHTGQNWLLVGPGASATTTGISIKDDSGVTGLVGMCFRNISMRDWPIDVILGFGAHCATFDTCQFTITAGAHESYSVINGGSTNS